MRESGWNRLGSFNIHNNLKVRTVGNPHSPVDLADTFIGALMSNKNLDNRQPSRGVAHHDRATSPSLNLSQYPASSKFWVDRRPCVNDHVNVGVQCPDIALQDTFHEVSKATVGHSASEWQSTAQEPNSYLRDSQTIQLSSEQKEVLALVRSGRNVFFTGPAGMFTFFQVVRCVPESAQGPENLSCCGRSSRNLKWQIRGQTQWRSRRRQASQALILVDLQFIRLLA